MGKCFMGWQHSTCHISLQAEPPEKNRGLRSTRPPIRAAGCRGLRRRVGPCGTPTWKELGRVLASRSGEAVTEGLQHLGQGRPGDWGGCGSLREPQGSPFGHCPRLRGARHHLRANGRRDHRHVDDGAAKILRHIAQAVAARLGEEPGPTHATLVQELCVVVRSHRAKAALRCRCEAAAAGEQ